MPIAYVERDAAQISRAWKCSQLVFHLVAFLASLVACIPMEKVKSSFHGNCILYSTVTVSFVEGRVKVSEDPVRTRWGSHSTCAFCFYTTIVSVIYAVVFGWFYAVCPRGGRPSRWRLGSSEDTRKSSIRGSAGFVRLSAVEYSPRKPWRLVFPSLLFSCHMAVAMLAASTVLMTGASHFCAELKNQTEISCRALQEVPWENYYLDMDSFYTNIVLAETGCWISSFAWCAIAATGLLRCCLVADFVAPKLRKLSTTNVPQTSAPGTSVADFGEDCTPQ